MIESVFAELEPVVGTEGKRLEAEGRQALRHPDGGQHTDRSARFVGAWLELLTPLGEISAEPGAVYTATSTVWPARA